ncbi:hypothetical protein PTKIN_Ptkin06aG0054900 [Pterospermum kingtungense]
MLRMGSLSYKCSNEEVDQKAKALRAAANYTPSEDASPVDISHKINRLAFGDCFPSVVNPLDSVQWTQEQPSGMYEYFVKVVPTVYTDTPSNLWPINLTLLSSFSITYLHYFIPYGIGATASTRVASEMGAGNAQAAKMARVASEMGAGNAQAAKMAFWIVLVIVMVETVTVSTIIFFSPSGL